MVQFVIQHVTVRLAVGVAAWGLTNNMHKTYSYIHIAQVFVFLLYWLVIRVLSGLNILYTCLVEYV